MFTKSRIVFTSALILGLSGIGAQATPYSYNLAQSNISSLCTNAHMMSMSYTQSEIEESCPAGIGGTGITLSEFQRSYNFSLQTPRQRIFNMVFSGPSGVIVSDNALNGSTTGLNAGDGFSGLSVWGNVTTNSLDNEFVLTPYDSRSKVFTVGADTLLNDQILVGASFSFDETDVTTNFNGGTQDVKRYGITGYAGMPVNENISVDMSVGYSRLDTDQNRLLSAFEIAAGTTLGAAAGAAAGDVVTSEVESHLLFFAANLNAFRQINDWLLSARLGVVYSDMDNNTYNETHEPSSTAATIASTDTELGQFIVGGEVSYNFNSPLEPYFGADFIHDFTSDTVNIAGGLTQPSDDDTEFLFRAGMRYFGSNGVSAIAEVSTNASRDDIDTTSFTLTVRADF